MHATALALSAALALGAAACGGSTAPTVAEPILESVNRAHLPIVAPGDTAAWVGFGFGAVQGDGAILVTTASGLATATVLSWDDGAAHAVLPADLVTGPTYVVTDRDTLGPLDLFVRDRAPYTAAARPWVEGPTLPLPLTDLQVAALRFVSGGTLGGLLLAYGGARTDGRLSDSTFLGTVDAEGRVLSWRAAPDTIVPAPRRHHAVVGADRTNAPLSLEGVAYVVGGVDSTRRLLPDVLGIALTAQGSYGLWTSLTPLPGARAGVAAVLAYGTVYVIGGVGLDSLASRMVSVARIRTDGTLNGWFAGPRLPEGRAFAAAVVAGTTLYVIGGERGLVRLDSTADTMALSASVYAIPLSRQTGAFADSVWTELGVVLTHPRARHGAFALDDALVVTGGVYAGMPSTGETEFALVGPDGSVSTFQELPQTTIASVIGGPPWSFGAPTSPTASGGSRGLVVGGRTPAGPTARTWSQ